MGNKIMTSPCFGRGGDWIDLEELDDTNFDFISVSMQSNGKQSSTSAIPTVKLIPVESIAPKINRIVLAPMKSDSETDMKKDMTFNEHLNCLTWDPETQPSYFKRQEMAIMDEYDGSTKKFECTDVKKGKAKGRRLRRWCDRLFRRGEKRQRSILKHVERKIRKTESMDSIIKVQRSGHDAQKEVDASTKSDSAGPSSESCENELEWKKVNCSESYSDDPLSETESECSSCYSDKIEDSWWSLQNTEMTSNLISQSNAQSQNSKTGNQIPSSDLEIKERLVDHICDCGCCPQYNQIEDAVTRSGSWMNEYERLALCRILQAYSTYNESKIFDTDMILTAEECLVVFHGEDEAAFRAMIAYGRLNKWE